MALPTIGNVTRPRANGYGVRIDNYYYRLFATPDTPFSRENADLQAPRIDDQSTPEALSQDFGTSFSRLDFRGGEGLRLAHSPNNPPQAPTMFWDSNGISPNTTDQNERPSLQLNKAVENILSSVETNMHMAYDRDGQRLYTTDGVELKYTDTPFAATPTWTTEDPFDGGATEEIQDIAFYGGELFLALGTDGLTRRNSDGTFTAVHTNHADHVWAIKQRIMWGSENELYEVTGSGAGSSTLRLTVESGHTFNDMHDAGAVILVSSTDGYIYSLTVDEDTGSITVAGRFSINGEIPAAITGLDAVTLLTTYQQASAGFIAKVWLLTIHEGLLSNRQLIKQFGSTDTSHDYRIMKAATAGTVAFLGVDEDGDTHLWKYEYATTGISRNMGGSTHSGQVLALITVGNRMFYTVAGSGVVRESTDNVAEGYLITPLADNYSRDKKSWSSIVVDAEELGSTAKVKIYYSTDPDAIYNADHPTWRLWKTYSNADQVSVPTYISGVLSRYLTIKIVLTGNVGTTPLFNGFTVNASPGSSDIIYNLPINVSDVITKPRHKPVIVPGMGRKIHDNIKGLQGNSVTLEVLDPAETIQGTVMQIQEPIIHFPLRGSPIFIAQVQVRGRRVPSSGTVSISNSGASTGIGLLGVMHTGGKEI